MSLVRPMPGSDIPGHPRVPCGLSDLVSLNYKHDTTPLNRHSTKYLHGPSWFVICVGSVCAVHERGEKKAHRC